VIVTSSATSAVRWSAMKLRRHSMHNCTFVSASRSGVEYSVRSEVSPGCARRVSVVVRPAECRPTPVRQR
jgi:hypothetical protein